MNIIILGRQGSGKSTQAKLLAEKFGFCYISSGEIARQIGKLDDDEGKLVQQALDRGELIASDILFQHIKRVLASPQCEKGFVLDGYPRDKVQLELLELFLQDKGQKVDEVVYIDINEELVISRLLERAKIEQREDDTPEIIKRRLEIYNQETEQIVDYYRNMGRLIVVDGSFSIETVHQEILRKLTLE